MIFAGCLGAPRSNSAATAIALDSGGNVYLAGNTSARDFPLTPGAYDGRAANTISNNFLAKISGDGSRVMYSAQWDGETFGPYSIAVDSTGGVYVTGTTRTTIAAIGPALQPCPGPSVLRYNFLMRLNAAGSGPTLFSYENPDVSQIGVAVGNDGSVYEAAGPVRRIEKPDTAGGTYLSRLCVLNGASFRSHAENGQPGISPGEIVTLQGLGLGPETGVSASGSTVGSLLGDTQVVFDGIAAPLL